MKLCEFIDIDNNGSIVWIKEGCMADKKYKYSISAGVFVSKGTCEECWERRINGRKKGQNNLKSF